MFGMLTVEVMQSILADNFAAGTRKEWEVVFDTVLRSASGEIMAAPRQ